MFAVLLAIASMFTLLRLSAMLEMFSAMLDMLLALVAISWTISDMLALKVSIDLALLDTFTALMSML